MRGGTASSSSQFGSENEHCPWSQERKVFDSYYNKPSGDPLVWVHWSKPLRDPGSLRIPRSGGTLMKQALGNSWKEEVW